jgi:hypothetical protein
MLAVASVEAGLKSFAQLTRRELRKVLSEMRASGGDEALYYALLGDILEYIKAEESVFDGRLGYSIENAYVTPVAKTVKQLLQAQIEFAANTALNLVVSCNTQHLTDDFDVLKNAARRDVLRNSSVRTSTLVQGVSAHLSEQLLLSLFDEYVWISTIDSRTTDICRSRHLNVYKVGLGPKPPAHNFCRSCTAPYKPGGGMIEDHSFGDWLSFANISSKSEFLSDDGISINKYKELVGELWH